MNTSHQMGHSCHKRKKYYQTLHITYTEELSPYNSTSYPNSQWLKILRGELQHFSKVVAAKEKALQ